MSRRLTILAASIALLSAALDCPAQGPGNAFIWELTGDWQVNRSGATLHPGDLLNPGTLLSSRSDTPQHAIILIADGRRLFLDCHDHDSCARGFRLPPMTQAPNAAALRDFQQISSLRRQSLAALAEPGASGDVSGHRPANVLLNEAVSILDPDGSTDIASALHSLPPGDYHLVVEQGAGKSGMTIHWDNAVTTLKLPVITAGPRDVTFYSEQQTARMRLSLLVVAPHAYPDANYRLLNLRRQLNQWNNQSPGWPVHQFLQLYLQALANNLPDPPSTGT